MQTAWALAHTVAHSEVLAAATCSAGALPVLVAALGATSSTAATNSAAVRRCAASALSDVARYSPALAAAVVQAGALGAAAAQLRSPLNNDARLRRQLLCLLMHVARADAALAERVVGASLVPDIGRCLKFAGDDTVRHHAAACLRDIVRHSASLAAAVTDAPGVLDALAAFAASGGGAAAEGQALPALLAFGFAGGHSAELATAVAAAPGAVPALVAALQGRDDPGAAAAAWALGRLGTHTPALAHAAAAGLPRLLELAAAAPEGGDLSTKCLKAVAAIVPQLADMPLLARMVQLPAAAALPQVWALLLARCSAPDDQGSSLSR